MQKSAKPKASQVVTHSVEVADIEIRGQNGPEWPRRDKLVFVVVVVAGVWVWRVSAKRR